MRVPLGQDGWYLCDAADQPDFEYREFRGDEALAFQWLNQFRGDGALFGELRRLLDLPWRYNDSQELRQVASRLARGVWLARRPVVRLPGRWGESAKEAPAFPLEERHAPPPTSQPAPEPGVFPESVDFVAIAQAQKEAAELGIPFCEECEKARLAAQHGNA